MLCAKFGVNEFPTLLVLTDPEGYAGEKYEGELKVDQLQKFFNTFAYSQPKNVVRLEFMHLDERKYKQGICGPKTSELCVVLDTSSEIEA